MSRRVKISKLKEAIRHLVLQEINEQDNKPSHFGGGKNINILGLRIATRATESNCLSPEEIFPPLSLKYVFNPLGKRFNNEFNPNSLHISRSLSLVINSSNLRLSAIFPLNKKNIIKIFNIQER